MKRITQFLLFAVFVLLTNFLPQPSQAQKKITVAFYNTENMFDTIDDPHKNDNDYLPGAKLQWDSKKYFKKIENIGKALSSFDSSSVKLPTLIGLSEVENETVLNDLIKRTNLKKGGYKIVHEKSPDIRGIDVALLYRAKYFKYISHKAIAINFPDDKNDKTRDILYVKGIVGKSDTLNLFINHWPSRFGGQEQSDPKRQYVASVLRHYSDSLLSRNPKAYILMEGDLNDEPNNQSVANVLNAQKPGDKIYSQKLYNLLYKKFEKGEGTIYYKDWDVFDQIIVSGNFLNKGKKGLQINEKDVHIFKPEWMLYKNKKGEWVPNRTESGGKYFGGYSDHLPVYVNIIAK